MPRKRMIIVGGLIVCLALAVWQGSILVKDHRNGAPAYGQKVDLSYCKQVAPARTTSAFDVKGAMTAPFSNLAYSFGVVVNSTEYTVGTFPVPAASVSPDLQRMVFTTGSGLMVADAGSPNVHQLTLSGPGVTDWNASWSPDGRRIAFIREYEDNDSDLYVVSADGSNLHLISQQEAGEVHGSPGYGYGNKPIWSPDGRYLAVGVKTDVSPSRWEVRVYSIAQVAQDGYDTFLVYTSKLGLRNAHPIMLTDEPLTLSFVEWGNSDRFFLYQAKDKKVYSITSQCS